MDNIAGPPVGGDNFFGRATDIARLVALLDQHDVLLLGPRRIGKTSLARAVMRVLATQAEPWLTVEINAASCQNEREFVDRCLDELRKLNLPKLRQWLQQAGESAQDLFARVTKVEVASTAGVTLTEPKEPDWIKLANSLLEAIGNAKRRWLIYIDELPIFLVNLVKNDPAHGIARVRRFLDWFRNDVRRLPKGKAIRWLLTGSIGLDSLVQRHGMADTINSLSHQTLPPPSEAEACAMVLKIAHSNALALGCDDALALVQAVGWPQPYYLQKLLQLLREQRAHDATGTMAGQIERAIQALVEPSADNDFRHWETRLQDQLGTDDGAHALALLGRAAAKPEGLLAQNLFEVMQRRLPDSSEELQRLKFAQLRDALIRDGYWAARELDGARRYAFVLEPLRRWWHRRYTP